MWKRSVVVAAREGTGTDLSRFDGSLKHCSECGAFISLTIPPFSLLCCNEHGLRGRLVTKHRARLGEVYKIPACMASKEGGRVIVGIHCKDVQEAEGFTALVHWNLNTFSEASERERWGQDKSVNLNNCASSVQPT